LGYNTSQSYLITGKRYNTMPDFMLFVKDLTNYEPCAPGVYNFSLTLADILITFLKALLLNRHILFFTI